MLLDGWLGVDLTHFDFRILLVPPVHSDVIRPVLQVHPSSEPIGDQQRCECDADVDDADYETILLQFERLVDAWNQVERQGHVLVGAALAQVPGELLQSIDLVL